MYDVSIIIPTYRRPRLLDKTLRSCANQKNYLGLNFEIIIVDNCPEKSALTTVEQFARQYAISVNYVNEHRTNVSLARNAGIAHSQAPMFAFLDDDQEAKQDWLDQIVQAQRRFDSDAVLGVRIPVFETDAPPHWFHAVPYCQRRFSQPSGAIWNAQLGASTGNSLIRASTSLLRDPPFDPEFGRTGSEDLDFFMDLAKSGGRLVCCGEAIVTELIAEDRANIGYMMRRFFRESQGYVRCMARHSDNPVLSALLLMSKGFAQIAIWSIPGVVLAPLSTPLAARAKQNLARGAGKIFWFRCFQINFYGG